MIRPNLGRKFLVYRGRQRMHAGGFPGLEEKGGIGPHFMMVCKDIRQPPVKGTDAGFALRELNW